MHAGFNPMPNVSRVRCRINEGIVAPADNSKGAHMSTKRLLVAGVLIGIAAIVGCGQRGNSDSGVIGVWRVSETTLIGPIERTVTNPQPGIVIFTPRYYSRNLVNSDAPRPELPPEGKRTDKQIADAFGPFIANAGTYEIRGSELTTKRIAAKNPAEMRAGNFLTFTFRLEGRDTLWLTSKMDENGPLANPTAVKLTRLE